MPIEEKNWTVKIQGSSHKRNTRKEFKHPEITEQYNIINLLVHVPRNTGLPQKIQTKHTGTIN